MAENKHHIGFPIYSISFTPTNSKLIIGGGGGPNKSGVPNPLSIYQIASSTSIKLLTKFNLGFDQDAVNSLVLHPKNKFIVVGVNQSAQEILDNGNWNLRVFIIDGEEFVMESAVKSVKDNADDYQKVACYSPDGLYLVTGSYSGLLCFFTSAEASPNKLIEHLQPMDLKDEIFDVSVSSGSSLIAVCTSKKCMILDIKTGTEVWSISDPIISKQTCQFRSLRFGSNKTSHVLFVVINRKDRSKAYINKYTSLDGKTWQLSSSKVVSNKSIVSFSIDKDGEYLAFGAADLSVNVLSSHSLSPILRVKDVHGFPATCLDFHPKEKLVVSGSADGDICLFEFEEPRVGWIMFLLKLILMILLLTLIAAVGYHVVDEQDL